MSNSYFQFKQFRVEQDRCAMKVTTDACIQGAWTPLPPHVRTVLDVGAGSGLLSLMLAQRSAQIVVDAIEYDAAAAAQARENIQASPWCDRIDVLEGDAAHFAFGKKYDLIICNPPFFINSLLGDKESRNHARHAITLAHSDLLYIVNNYLDDGGYLSILLPAEEYMLFKNLMASEGWTEQSFLAVKHMPGAAVKRVVGLFGRDTGNTEGRTLVIRNETDEYTSDFISLLSPFYLAL